MKNLIMSIFVMFPLITSVQAQNVYYYPDLVESGDSVSITIPLSIEVIERPSTILKDEIPTKSISEIDNVLQNVDNYFIP